MCGIAGICEFGDGSVHVSCLKSMTAAIAHRGPDDEGYVLFGNGVTLELDGMETDAAGEPFFLGLGHRRLSIIDLSAAGHQPMPNEDGTIWITYNGEIYNFLEIREELRKRGHRFRSNTDSEVILHSYEQWGVDCLRRFNGMWAFALWDGKKRRLFCARDRFGIKPFYFCREGDRFLFASEIKAILAYPRVRRIPNDACIYPYLAYGHLDTTGETFFKGIEQLRGGHYLTVDLESRRIALSRYWDIKPETAASGKSDKTYADEFLELFTDAVRMRLRSDVTVGTCLSGGLDSSSIVCITSRLLGNNGLRTFSSCFEDERYDERPFIDEV
ncbi:MAG: asparagine synthase (glutamine-hydrolyzing), partial [Deltaproteobacteria bacterium]|nr:asparagine synthase (glutamine-hydrolyzing) [Deltaproteobacteria bacterium]